MGRIRFSLALLLCGCGLAGPNVGTVISPGVARAQFEARTSGTDLVEITVYFPADESGVARPGPWPAVVFIQGGFVGTTDYSWQASALAEAGYVVALPRNALEFAFFSVGYGQTARELLSDPPSGSLLEGLVDSQRIAVAGHSLGSVVALKLALTGNFAAVALEAGFPDKSDLDALASFSRPSLSLAGGLDCSAKLEAVRAGWEAMPSPTALTVLADVTHHQFTNSDEPDRTNKCVPQLPLADAHARMRDALVGFLDAALSDGGVGEAALRQVPGATVEVR